MSGLEVVAAITSIIALVEFSQKVLTRAAEFRENGKEIGEAFQCINDLLPPINHAVERTKERIENKEIDEDTCKALIPLHRGVERTLEELNTVLKKYTPADGASKVEVLWKAGKGIFQEKKVKGVLQRLHEYVGVLTLSYTEAASAGTFSSIDRDNVQQILANVARSNTTQAASLPRKCRNLLSLDGGGLRGLSILYILRDLMAKVNEHEDPPLKPCEVFDLIGGSGTGGLIAVMLGRLGLTVDECLDEYLKLFERLAIEHDETTQAESDYTMIKSGIMKSTLTELVKAQGLPPDSGFRNKDNVSCYTLVCATARNTNTVVDFKNYLLPGEPDRRPATIVEVTCATLSSAKVFEAVQFGRPPSKYIAGELGANNPIDRVWNEALRIWGKPGGLEPLVSCVISVGAGSPRSRAIHLDGPNFANAMLDIAMQTEETAKKFILAHPVLGGKDKRYYRFNVNSLPELGWDGYGDSGAIMELANDYLEGHEQEVEQCAENLQRENLVPSHETKPIIFIPFDRNDSLVDRDSIFKALDLLLNPLSRNRSAAIWGLGGCGKTQVALEYAYRRQEKASCSVFWIHADSEARFTQDYTNLARIADLSPNLKGEDLLYAVKHWIEHQTNWLLILDNADDLSIFKKPYSATTGQVQSPDLLRFVPRTQSETILWTSRHRGILGSIVGVQRGIEVGAMVYSEAWRLFSSFCGRPSIREPLKEEQELLGRLERIPLAIAQAGSYIRETGVSVQQYLKFFDESESRQSNLLSHEYQDIYRSGVPNSVMRTWLISMIKIAKDSPCSEKILNTIAFFDNKGIPFELVQAAAGSTFSEDEVLVAASRLIEYSFLRVQRAVGEDLPTYDQHRLVQLATRQAMTSIQTCSFSGKALEIMIALFPSGKYETWKVCILYLPHALKAASWLEAEARKDRLPELLQHINQYYWEQGRSDEAEQLQVEVLELQKKALGMKHPDTIIAMANLAEIWRQQGRSDETEHLQVEVLELQKEVLGMKHPNTITARANIAVTWREQGQFNKAEQLQVEVLELRKKVSGVKHPDTIIAMAHLAATWRQQGRFDEAEQLQVEVLELRKKVSGVKHPNTITAMAHLAATWRQQGRFDEAEQLQVEVLELQKEALGVKHPYTITAMASLAEIWWQQYRFDEAEHLQVEVLELQKKVLGMKHPYTITAMAQLAATWGEQGQYNEAEQLEVEVLELQKEVLGANHHSTITAMANLARTWWQQGRLDEAEQLEVEVLKLSKEVLGVKHPNTISAMANLAATWRQQGRLDEAEQLEVEVLELRKEVLGVKHPDTISAMKNLAAIWRQQDRSDEAEQLEVEVLELQKEVSDVNHSDTTTAIVQLVKTNPKSIRLNQEIRSEFTAFSFLNNPDSAQETPLKSHNRFKKWTKKLVRLGKPSNS